MPVPRSTSKRVWRLNTILILLPTCYWIRRASPTSKACSVRRAIWRHVSLTLQSTSALLNFSRMVWPYSLYQTGLHECNENSFINCGSVSLVKGGEKLGRKGEKGS